MNLDQAQITQHPRTLLGAAWMTVANADGPHAQHLKAQAACTLGYHQQARTLWQGLADEGDSAAWFELACMAEWGLGETADMQRAQTLFLRAAELGHVLAWVRWAELSFNGPKYPG